MVWSAPATVTRASGTLWTVRSAWWLPRFDDPTYGRQARVPSLLSEGPDVLPPSYCARAALGEVGLRPWLNPAVTTADCARAGAHPAWASRRRDLVG